VYTQHGPTYSWAPEAIYCYNHQTREVVGVPLQSSLRVEVGTPEVLSPVPAAFGFAPIILSSGDRFVTGRNLPRGSRSSRSASSSTGSTTRRPRSQPQRDRFNGTTGRSATTFCLGGRGAPVFGLVGIAQTGDTAIWCSPRHWSHHPIRSSLQMASVAIRLYREKLPVRGCSQLVTRVPFWACARCWAHLILRGDCCDGHGHSSG
jgi:hypothetical protein